MNNRHTPAVARRLLSDFTIFALLAWAGAVVFIAALLTGVVAVAGDISTSAWQYAVQAGRWLTLGIGAHLTWTQLPLHVAYGVTRREFALQATVFMVGFTAALALMATAGFALELAVYRVNDWQQALAQSHLFATPAELPLVFAEHWLLYMVWFVTGALVAAGFYRDRALGVLLLLAGLLLIALAEVAIGTASFGPLPVFGVVTRNVIRLVSAITLAGASLAGAVAVCVGTVVAGLAMTWAVVRDLPLRT